MLADKVRPGGRLRRGRAVDTIVASIAEGSAVPPFWEDLPRDRAVQLHGADLSEFRDLRAPAPAVVVWQPGPIVEIGAILDELEQTATRLFPAWLQGAESVEGRSTLAVAAIRTLAHRQAARISVHGPFLADLAERALRGQPTGVRFPEAVRALGFARVIAAGSHRSHIAVIVDVLPCWTQSTREALASVCERVAQLGHFGVWLIGTDIPMGRIRSTPLGGVPGPVAQPVPDVIDFPPQAGGPHPGSSVERALEAALRTRAWAAERQWNQTYRIHTLANPVRLDLLWAEERLNVEIDGPEHHDPAHYAEDRRRDVDLQLAGYAVLRFTNAEIEHDVGAVVARIERFITSRREAV